MRKWSGIGAAAAIAMLAACGGGSSGSNNSGGGGGGATINRPPSFTNASDIAFVETTTSVDTRTVVQLAASDADGDALTFDFVAGKDAALFSFFGQNGAIGFNDSVSFETPRDGDGDNVYEVDVSVTDGTATTRQTIAITITNDTENLLITELATGLGNSGHVQYIDDTNQLLVVSQSGQVSTVDAATGAVTSHGLFGGGGIEIIDIVDDGSFATSGRFFALVDDAELRLYSIDIADLSSRILYINTTGSKRGSLGLRGSRLLLALEATGDSAQFPSNPSGSISELRFTGGFGDPQALEIIFSLGWGLRDPRLITSSNAQGWVIDTGVEFNELNQGLFELSNARANFEWPYRDGLKELQTPPATISGVFVVPRIVQELASDGPSKWVDASDSLQGDGWGGVFIISDVSGNIWTWDALNDGPIERRNLDFGFEGLAETPLIVSMDDGDFDVGNANPIYMLTADGRLLMVDLES